MKYPVHNQQSSQALSLFPPDAFELPFSTPSEISKSTGKPSAVVKWAGGKQALASHLVSYFPDQFSTYYEPFLGGSSILLALNPDHAVAGDMNEWLIDTYEALRTDWQEVARILDALPNTKEDYLEIRSIDPSTLDVYHRAAHFIYLNKTCFRGLFRVNAQGRFNVPYGEYNRRYYDSDNLSCFSNRLRKVTLRKGDFELVIANITSDDFVYFDPPYYKAGGFSDFNRYTRYQFREGDHIRLAALCRELDARGVRWAVSNSDTPFVRELFDGYVLHPIASRREINLQSENRDTLELLIRNFGYIK